MANDSLQKPGKDDGEDHELSHHKERSSIPDLTPYSDRLCRAPILDAILRAELAFSDTLPDGAAHILEIGKDALLVDRFQEVRDKFLRVICSGLLLLRWALHELSGKDPDIPVLPPELDFLLEIGGPTYVSLETHGDLILSGAKRVLISNPAEVTRMVDQPRDFKGRWPQIDFSDVPLEKLSSLVKDHGKADIITAYRCLGPESLGYRPDRRYSALLETPHERTHILGELTKTLKQGGLLIIKVVPGSPVLKYDGLGPFIKISKAWGERIDDSLIVPGFFPKEMEGAGLRLIYRNRITTDRGGGGYYIFQKA